MGSKWDTTELRDAEQGTAGGGLDQRFRTPLFSYFSRRVRDNKTAEELTQEVFIRLANSLSAQFTELPEAQVFRTASAVFQDWNRHCEARRHATATPLAAVSETLGTPSVSLDERARNLAFAAKAALRELEGALSGLSKRTRDIFLLSRVENVSHQEIAKMHRISVTCVDSHVMKAVLHLCSRAYES